MFISLLFIILEADTGKEVTRITPAGLISSVIIVGHGVIATLVPDFIVVRRAADVTRHARVVLTLSRLAGTLVTHFVLAGVNRTGNSAAALRRARFHCSCRRAGSRGYWAIGDIDLGVIKINLSRSALLFRILTSFAQNLCFIQRGTKSNALLLPSLEMFSDADGTALTGSASQAVNLLEGFIAFNTCSVGVSREDFVFGAVNSDFALRRTKPIRSRGRTPVIDDVPFDQRVLHPTVNTRISIRN